LALAPALPDFISGANQKRLRDRCENCFALTLCLDKPALFQNVEALLDDAWRQEERISDALREVTNEALDGVRAAQGAAPQDGADGRQGETSCQMRERRPLKTTS
jgi:hypothetical protein